MKIAAVFSVLVSMVALLEQQRFARAAKMPLVEVVALYFVLGLVFGAVVGVLRPLTRTVPGSALVGAVAGLLFGLGAALGVIGLPWDSTSTLMCATYSAAAAFGAARLRLRLDRGKSEPTSRPGEQERR